MLAGTGVRKIYFYSIGFSPIKIHFSDYMKNLICRLNKVYVFFNKILLAIFIEKYIYFVCNRLFCCNHTCYCICMVSVTSVPR